WSFALNHEAPVAPMTIKLPPIVTKTSSEVGTGSALVASEIAPAKAVGIRVNWPAVVVGVWLAGFALVLLHRAGVGLRLRRLAGESRAMKEGRVLAMARELSAACGVRAEIRESETCRVPLAFGVWRPTVLLPGEAMGWSDGRLSAALQHEFGHIRRRDCLTRWFADLACAFYWMNPLVWLGARSLRLAQEQACDDLVLNAGTRPDAYATQLVEVVRSLQGDRFTARHALAMAQPSTLETRVRAIVDESRDRSARSVRGAFAGITFATAALALCTAAQLRGADEKKVVPAANPSASVRKQIQIKAKFIEITGDDPSLPDFLKQTGKMEKPGVVNIFPDGAALDQLNAAKGVDVLSAPSVITRAKQAALIEIVREYNYATEWDRNAATSVLEATAFEMRDVGIKFGVTPDIDADGNITLAMSPEVVEIEGLIDLDGDPKTLIAKPDAAQPAGKWTAVPNTGKIPKGHRAQPVFKVRKITSNVTVQSGQTIVIGGFESPDAIGEAKSDGMKPKKQLVVLVTAHIVKPGEIPKAEPAGAGDAQNNPRGKTGAATESKPYGKGPDSVTADKKTDVGRPRVGVRIEPEPAIIPAAADGIAPKKTGAAAAAEKIIFPKVDFRDATVREVVDFLIAKSKTLDAAGAGANIVIANAEGLGDTKITLSLTETPLSEVLRYVAALANGEVRKEEFAFVISPKQAGKVPAPNADREKGGSNAPTAPAPEQPETAVLKKARAIIFPKIELRDATLSETVDFLRAKAQELDPAKQGVNIVLTPQAGGANPKITLGLKNVPLIEIIKYVAALVGYEFVADDHAITLRPAVK
ncbi:MAG: M56 family metallopeptidase, partial [Chthoniobacteraceae bacterium]